MKYFQKISHKERMRQIDYRARQADRQEERAIQRMIRQAMEEKRAASQPVQETSDKEREEILMIARLHELAERK